MQRAERCAHPLRFRDRDGVGKEWGAAVRAEPGDGLGRQIAVEHDGGRAVEHVEVTLQIIRRDGSRDVRVTQAELHLTAFVRDVQVRRCAPAGHVERAAEIHAELHAVVAQELGVRIAAKGGEKLDLHAEQAQIVRNVAPDTAGRERDGTGVGVAEDELLFRAAANVEIHGADHTDILVHACTSQMRSAYSRTARSAAKMPLRAMLTSDRRARTAGSAIVAYRLSCVAA